jgi:type VI secretion system Hcp family effector
MSAVLGALAVALLAILATPDPALAFSMVAVIETQTRGPLTCGSTARGLEGTQPLLGVSDEFVFPSELAGGEPGAVLQVKPVVVIKEVDRCSPPLFAAMMARETITRVEIRLYDRQGVHFFTIRLENARVTRMSRTVRQQGLHEEVAFAFQVIHLIDERTGATASHDFAS